MGILLATVGWSISVASTAIALEVSHVYHEPRQPINWNSSEARIHFRISEPAQVTVSIFDGRNVRIRELSPSEALGHGDHTLKWDGLDEQGRRVPAEAYSYTVSAIGVGGNTAEWDITDVSGGKTKSPKDIRWDPKAGVVHYTLGDTARVRIRMGLRNDGPLLRTLIDWVPRAAGVHTQVWDGKDSSGVLDLSRHPELEIQVESFTLPKNTILTGFPPDQVSLIEDLTEPLVRRTLKATSRRRMFDYANQPIESRRDFPARLELPPGLPRNKDGLPVVTGPVPVRVSVDDADLAQVLNERCEVVFYVDGRMAFENQVSFLPMTWTWDPGNTSGVHYITANLRGYEGHFGIQTLTVFVEPGGATK